MRGTHRPDRLRVRIAALLVGVSAGSALGAELPARYALPLVWHVESAEGAALESAAADGAINPASILKVATTLWALERLGPRHRFETIFAARGTLDAETGVLHGDLVVLGGRDPDFHVENAFLVARMLERSGLREVSGRLIVDDSFWIGWEGGADGILADADQRATRMALRLRDALDPSRYSRGTKREWSAFAARRSLDPAHPPRVVVLGGVGVERDPGPVEMLALHRGNELVQVLKRFNAYSNNDIERLGPSLGPPAELEGFLAERLFAAAGEVRVQTLSGLGQNRMSPRLIVRLMHEFRASCARRGLRVEDVLPVAGCDPGTMTSFPLLAAGPAARSLVGKTGTLTNTDGGISAVAGFLETTGGQILFCVAAPGASGRLGTARRVEQAWLLDRLEAHGGPRPLECGIGPWNSDADARVLPPRSDRAELDAN
jgi:D-alanyl-D-alanine carboxypeptidase/D-alanyl-D-alanine-endopeptidase (penicillin-binding protein 4)